MKYERLGPVLSAWKRFWTLNQLKQRISVSGLFSVLLYEWIFFSCCEQIPGKKQFEEGIKERKGYFDLQPQKGIQSTVSRRVWCQLLGSQWSYFISRSQEQTGSGDCLESFKACPYRATSYNKALSPEGSTTYQKSTSSWEPSVQTHQPTRVSS